MSERRIAAALLERTGNNPLPYVESTPLKVKALDLADPRPGEVLVRIDAAGICHSDLSVINGDRPRQMPMVLGHEASGTVLMMGDSSDTSLAVGDRVVLVFLPACGQCPQCLGGQSYLCAVGQAANGRGELIRGGSRLSCTSEDGGHSVYHHLGVSAFATQAVVDRRSLVKIDSDIPPEIAALFGCAVLTGVGAVMNTAQTRPGESVTIYGLGGVGLAALLGAVAVGAQPIRVVDPAPEKLALALELGAWEAFAPDADEGAAGSDVVIETVGKAAVLAHAYRSAGRGARIVTVSLPNPNEEFNINALSLVAEVKTLMGSFMGSCVPERDIPRYIALWRAGSLPVEKLLTSVNPLEEINELMDRMTRGEAVRQIVVPNQ